MTDQITSWNGKHILKIKSDPLREIEEIKDSKPDETVKDSPESLRKEIEPWLTALFQSEHLSLLMGTGITSAVHLMAKSELPQGMGAMDFSVFREQLEENSKESASRADRGTPNIEDQIRVANDLVRGLEIYLSSQPDAEKPEK